MAKLRLKAVCSLMGVIMLTGMLYGCGGGSVENGSGKSSSGDTSGDKKTTLTILNNWNGSSGPDNETTPVTQAIEEKTGIKMMIDYTKGSEVEKVNQIFATQDLPDIYTGPAWGGELDGIIKAAKEGQLVDLTDKIDKYPNLAKAIAKENVPPALYEKAIGGIDGKKYMMYQNQPATGNDVNDWLYGFYVRKDIAEKVGVDPQAVKTKDDLYQFLKKIKDANLTENGMPVMPMGGFHDGWAVGIGNTMFYGTSYMEKGDGSLENVFFTKAYEDYTLYYRKLIAEGLLDPEVFTQTDPIATEKIKQGRIAVLAAHYPAILDASKDYVKSHPGTDYVPVGPLERAGAEPNRPVDLSIQGNNVTVITKQCKDVVAALKLLDFLASDEGFMLVHYGVEGVHWEKVDGKPKAKQEWFDKFNENTTGKMKRNEGIAIGLENMTGLDRINSVGGGDIWADQDRLAAMDNARKILRPNGINIIAAFNPGDVITNASNWETLKPSMDQIGDVWKQAIFAKSDADALKVLNDLREQIKKTGYGEAMKYVNDQLKGKEVVKLAMPN